MIFATGFMLVFITLLIAQLATNEPEWVKIGGAMIFLLGLVLMALSFAFWIARRMP